AFSCSRNLAHQFEGTMALVHFRQKLRQRIERFFFIEKQDEHLSSKGLLQLRKRRTPVAWSFANELLNQPERTLIDHLGVTALVEEHAHYAVERRALVDIGFVFQRLQSLQLAM